MLLHAHLGADLRCTTLTVSCVDLIAVVKKTKPIEVEKKSTLTPRKFAEGSFEIPG